MMSRPSLAWCDAPRCTSQQCINFMFQAASSSCELWLHRCVFGIHDSCVGGASRGLRTRRDDWLGKHRKHGCSAEASPSEPDERHAARRASPAIRRKQREVPVLSSSAARDVEERRVTSDTSRLVRLMIHLHKQEGQIGIDSHIESWRRTVGPPHLGRVRRHIGPDGASATHAPAHWKGDPAAERAIQPGRGLPVSRHPCAAPYRNLKSDRPAPRQVGNGLSEVLRR